MNGGGLLKDIFYLFNDLPKLNISGMTQILISTLKHCLSRPRGPDQSFFNLIIVSSSFSGGTGNLCGAFAPLTCRNRRILKCFLKYIPSNASQNDCLGVQSSPLIQFQIP